MRIVAFDPVYNEKLSGITRALAEGIPGCEVHPMGDYVECDIAIIFGGYKRSYRPTWPKKEIMEKHKGRRLIMIESGYFNRGELYQVGFGGFAGGADFNLSRFAGEIPSDRFDSFGVEVLPWQKREKGPVLVMGQVPWDTQVQDMDHKLWCREIISKLEAKGETVYFRAHPRMKKPKPYGVPMHYRGKNIIPAKLPEALKSLRAVVTYNSTSSIDAILRGVPAVACDPSSAAWPVASHSVEEPLVYPDRSQWLAGIGYSLWTVDEMRSGETWQHLTTT